ncbi:hypothetical protein QJS10_CPB04g00766 [Acorus calamus]|uniref:DUF3444 domain-containing protein n=1 Tax=Acorus calamus TaxID=4465 RepID=A0AAV9EX86_ACOCL|nr:hypothetical protein QJS10_CPB04g00766 [Acorus calamus]
MEQPNLPTQTQRVFHSASVFWTLCPHCNAKYQYYQNVMNKPITCPNCVKSFVAYEIGSEGAQPKSSMGRTWNQSGSFLRQQVPVRGAPNVGQKNVASATSSKRSQGNSGGTGMPAGSSKVNSTMVDGGLRNKAKEDVNVNNVTQKEDKAGTKFKSVNLQGSEKGEQQGRPTSSFGVKRRKTKAESSDSDDTDSEDIGVEEAILTDNQNATALFSRYPRRSSRHKQGVTYKEDASDDDDCVQPPDLKRLRKVGSSDKEDARKDDVPPSVASVIDNEKGGKQEEGVRDENLRKANKQMQNHKRDGEVENEANCTIDLTSDSKTIPARFDYPDTEFYDFEKVREANKFSVDQIWAIYDDFDGMPRYYARIRKIYSAEFKLRITWLEADPISMNEIVWLENELPIACGNYKLGESEETENRLMFSHIISPSKGRRRNSYELYPRKGETWALFKDWNMKWTSNPDTFRKYDYEIVEVLSDYSWKEGVTVGHMVKVEGFICLFQRSMSEGASFHVPPSEILRFSHPIPSFRLTGQERNDVPAGSLELDPASLPPDIDMTSSSKSPTNAAAQGETEKDHEKAAVQLRNPGKSHAESEVEAKKIDNCNHSCSKPSLEGKSPPIMYRKPMSSMNNVDNGINRENEGLNGCVANKPDDANTFECQTSKGNQIPDTDVSSPQSITLTYPDPEFHSFEQERSVGNFQRGQVWALYSDVDSYPKYYALIKKVELEYFRVHISWLELCPASKADNQWIDNELPAGCGIFKVTSSADETYDSVETFSHQMRVVKAGRKNQYAIYPSKHEIWAVYKNWSSSWKESDLNNCELDVVEVLTDNAPFELSVLEKVNGYRSVFRKKSTAVNMKITKDGILRFSHRISSFRLTEERGGKLRGCFELDPASVPQELLFDDAD